MGKKRNASARSVGEVMFNLTLMKGLYIAIIVVNLFLPLFSTGSWGYASLFPYVILVFHTLSFLNGIALIQGQSVHIFPVIIIRTAELVWYQLLPWVDRDLNWSIYSIILIADMLFILLLLLDKSSYEYEVGRPGDM